jgi:class 3 adenylate cyclase
MSTCAACGAPLPDAARFCPACGATVAPAAPAEMLKLVTVLFADVVGSTARAERMHPEDTRALMAECSSVSKAGTRSAIRTGGSRFGSASTPAT